MCLGTLGTPGQGGAPCEPPSRAPWPGTTAYLAVLAHAPDEQGVLQGHIEAPAGDADVWGRRGDITLGMTAPQPSVGTPQPCPAVSRTHSPHVGITPELGTHPGSSREDSHCPPAPLQTPGSVLGVPATHPGWATARSQLLSLVPERVWDKPGLLSLSYPHSPVPPCKEVQTPIPAPIPGAGRAPAPHSPSMFLHFCRTSYTSRSGGRDWSGAWPGAALAPHPAVSMAKASPQTGVVPQGTPSPLPWYLGCAHR